MPDDIDLPPLLGPKRKPTAERPLLGLTVLVVEDSRFACEAMRLLCLRSGARIRRADCLASAHRHLAVYRPTAVVIDLGLPDGSGADLIKELAQVTPRVPVILGTSGTADANETAMTAGADGFLLKPISNLTVFQQAILQHLPKTTAFSGPKPVSKALIDPDPIALKDDLAHIADILSSRSDPKTLDYVAQFLASIASSAIDSNLAEAAANLSQARARGTSAGSAIAHINSLVGIRLAQARTI
ncbi:MAG: CheY-like chemotaxis protein [Paracoccaceae bacterium]|mgnify:CR=1 FL=1